VVRHVCPLALVRVVEVPFDSSEFVRLADTHADRAMAYLVIHTFISALTSSRDRLLASPSELPQRYVHGSSSAQSVSRWFTAARDDLTMFGTECSGRHRLVGRKRELCTGGHGECGAEREMRSCCFAVGGEVGWWRRRTRVRFHLFLRTHDHSHVLTHSPSHGHRGGHDFSQASAEHSLTRPQRSTTRRPRSTSPEPWRRFVARTRLIQSARSCSTLHAEPVRA
jgi:hypothetical protein